MQEVQRYSCTVKFVLSAMLRDSIYSGMCRNATTVACAHHHKIEMIDS